MGTVVAVDELDALIEEAGRRGCFWHRFRVDRHGPEVLAGVLAWRGCADVLVLVDDETSHAYRTPKTTNSGVGTSVETDVLAPTLVHWWYGGSEVGMVWVLRALLSLPRPDERCGLAPLRPAPPGTGVPGDRIPVQVRRWLGR